MKYGSVCSGIEAATVAFEKLGWSASFLSEIEPFPRSVLAHHYPETPLHGDFTTIQDGMYEPIELLVGGTPCQSFSIAGLRAGLDDPRGNLMLEFGALARRLRPSWLVWENVPGVLSSNGGRDFGTFLGMLGEIGYGFAYRVLDAQYFGVPQRRRRVFVVGYFGDWRVAAAVLFERHSLQGNPAPSRKAGQEVAPTIRAGATNGGAGHGARSGDSKDELIVPFIADIAPTLNAHFGSKQGLENQHIDSGGGLFVATGCNVPQRGSDWAAGCRVRDFDSGSRGGFDVISFGAQNSATQGDGVGEIVSTLDKSKTPAVAYGIRTANTSSNGWGIQEELTHTLDQAQGLAIASVTPYEQQGRRVQMSDGVAPTIMSNPKGGMKLEPVFNQMQVRRLTPRECERLQGFPDDYTLVPHRGKPAADGPRYKALGNSMAVPVMKWIGERIQMVDGLVGKRQMEIAA